MNLGIWEIQFFTLVIKAWGNLIQKDFVPTVEHFCPEYLTVFNSISGMYVCYFELPSCFILHPVV